MKRATAYFIFITLLVLLTLSGTIGAQETISYNGGVSLTLGGSGSAVITFDGIVNTTVNITVSGDCIDGQNPVNPRFSLTDPEGEFVVFDDDSGGGCAGLDAAANNITIGKVGLYTLTVFVGDDPGIIDVSLICVEGACPVSDTDGDTIPDANDNCLLVPNPDQADSDDDGRGDLCADTDNDGINDLVDNCPAVANPDQRDLTLDGIGDACDDYDADNIADSEDNCPLVENADQTDADNNGIGDECEETDTDADGHLDGIDNCPAIANPDQSDTDEDDIGDACQPVIQPNPAGVSLVAVTDITALCTSLGNETNTLCQTLLDAASAGVQSALGVSASDTTSLFNLDASGSALVKVCIQGQGAFVYLDSTGQPDAASQISTVSDSGFTCAEVQAGRIVTMLISTSPNVESGGDALQNCTVSTPERVRLRSEPTTDSAILVTLPEGTSLPAERISNNWFLVTYEQQSGWVSGDVVTATGDCSG